MSLRNLPLKNKSENEKGRNDMTLQEFYARVGGDYNATLSRLPSEALVKKFILKYPATPALPS